QPAMLEIAQPAVDELGRGRRGAGSEIVLLDQKHAQPPAGGVAGDPGAVDAAADDREIERVHRFAPGAAWRGTCRWATVRSVALTRAKSPAPIARRKTGVTALMAHAAKAQNPILPTLPAVPARMMRERSTGETDGLSRPPRHRHRRDRRARHRGGEDPGRGRGGLPRALHPPRRT